MTEPQAKAIDAALELLMERMGSPTDKDELEILHGATNAMAQMKAEDPTNFNRPTDPMIEDWDALYKLCDDDAFPRATALLIEKGRDLMDKCQRSFYPPSGPWIETTVQQIYEEYCSIMADYQG